MLMWLILTLNMSWASDCHDSIKSTFLADEVIFTVRGNQIHTTQALVGGKKAGYMTYHFMKEDFVQIGLAVVDDDFKGKGIYKRMFDEMMRANPHVKRIEAYLIEDNFDAALKVVGKKLVYSTGDCINAVSGTPSFKVKRQHGFIITVCEMDKLGIHVIFKR
jgi:predicted GNAT family acetyltransferase